MWTCNTKYLTSECGYNSCTFTSSKHQKNPQNSPQYIRANAYVSNTLAPPGRVEHDAHQATRDDTSARKSDKPTHVDPCDHAPIDSPPSTVAQTDADSGACDALSGRDGKGKLGGHNNGYCGTEFHGKTTSRRVKSDLITQCAHDVVAVRPETDNDASSTESEDPKRDRNFVADFSTMFVLVRRNVGRIVGHTYVDQMK
jgi:hypothetical protein